jgi:hypothetical protein
MLGEADKTNSSETADDHDVDDGSLSQARAMCLRLALTQWSGSSMVPLMKLQRQALSPDPCYLLRRSELYRRTYPRALLDSPGRFDSRLLWCHVSGTRIHGNGDSIGPLETYHQHGNDSKFCGLLTSTCLIPPQNTSSEQLCRGPYGNSPRSLFFRVPAGTVLFFVYSCLVRRSIPFRPYLSCLPSRRSFVCRKSIRSPCATHHSFFHLLSSAS